MYLVFYIKYFVYRNDVAMPLQIRRNGVFIFIRQNLLTILTVIGVLSGTLLGWSLRASGIQVPENLGLNEPLQKREGQIIKWKPGGLFSTGLGFPSANSYAILWDQYW